MEDGFLLPYQDLLRIAAEEGSDPAEYVVHVPDEYSLQFSYATEHVSHDAALAMLLRLEQAVDKVKGRVEGPWDAVRTWLSERVAEVWQARGAFPGLGAALTAFGITDGVLLAHALARHLGDHDDPWPTVDAWIADADNPADIDVGSVLRRTWQLCLATVAPFCTCWRAWISASIRPSGCTRRPSASVPACT